MTYKALLEMYKNGQLNDEDYDRVTKDIERQKAIGDYLFNEDFPYIEDIPIEGGTIEGDDEDTLLLIKKTMRRAFIKTGVISGAIVLVLVLAVIFILPGVVDKFYYDPLEEAGIDSENNMVTDRMSLDMSVYSELFLPQAFRNSVNAEREGYGEYFISVPQVVYSLDGSLKTVNGRLERNKLKFYDTDTFKPPVSNAFMMPEGTNSKNIFDDTDGKPIGPMGKRDAAIEALKNKQDGYYGAFVSLKEATSYEDAVTHMASLVPGSPAIWCAVYTEDEWGYLIEDNIGFRVRGGGICLDWDREKYPRLSLYDNGGSTYDDWQDEGRMKEHFVSLLKYMRDNYSFRHLMENMSFSREEALSEMISYVEENGLKVYGFYVEDTKENLLKLWDDENISYVYVTNLK